MPNPVHVVLGLDLGGTKLTSGLFTVSGKILYQRVLPLAQRRGREVGALIRKQISQARRFAVANFLDIRALGISVPGISQPKTGKVWVPNIPGWKNYPLRAEIIASLPEASLPVIIEDDRACYILGESWRGAARGCENAIFLAVGTGIGAGILTQGNVLRGDQGAAGSIGWMALSQPFRAEYVACGCFEHHASGAGLAKIARELMATDPAYHGVLKNIKPLTAADLFQHPRDPIAKKVLARAVECWGMAVANLVSLFNPQTIIFGGGVFGPAARFLPRILSEAKKWAQPVAIKHVRLQRSKLGGAAGLHGAAWLAWRSAGQNL